MLDRQMRTTTVHLTTLVLAGALALGCSSKSGGTSSSSSAAAASSSSPGKGSTAGDGVSAAECKALEAAADKADEKAVQLIVPDVTTYGELKEAGDEVEAASKILVAVDLKGAKLKAIRDGRTKKLDELVAAIRALKGDADAKVPKADAEKIAKLASDVNTGGVTMLADSMKICPLD